MLRSYAAALSSPMKVGDEGVGRLGSCRAAGCKQHCLQQPPPRSRHPLPHRPREQLGEWQGLLAGFTLGATHLVFFGAYALALWYGARRVAAGAMDGGKASEAGQGGAGRGTWLAPAGSRD